MAVPGSINHFQHPNQTRNLNRDQQLVYPGVNVNANDGISNQNTYAAKNKWIADIPLYLVLGTAYKNVNIRLCTFTIPAIEMGTDKVMYRSIEIERPTYTMSPGSKEITFNYFVSADWTDYRALYNWCMNNAPVNRDANALDTGNVSANGLIKACDIDVTLISPYKKPIIGFRFKNCWIKAFSDLQLSYAEADEIQHSFTCAYSHFVLLDRNGLEQQMNSPIPQGETQQHMMDMQQEAREDFLKRYGQKL